MIPKIAKIFNCNFIVHKYYETHNHTRIKIKTNLETDKQIQLLLYKDHYMLYTKLPISTFYLKNKQYIDEHYSTNPRKMMIREIEPKIHYKKDDTNVLMILKQMFELDMFEPITSNDQDIIRTCEFNNKLNDYVGLEYDEALCTRKIINKAFDEKWSQIYYADFETDVTVNPHKAYLCCLAYAADGKQYTKTIKGNRIAQDLLDFLKPDSLTYFHNLKYDACFFVNQADEYDVKVLQRNGTVIELILNHKTEKKKLTFHNSYSIIPAPLRAFPAMFKLNVFKEYMPYKAYTAENVRRELIPLAEFLRYYDAENGVNDHHKEIRKNAERIGALKGNFIHIMKYAEFYCKTDCVVLAQGLITFNRDLNQIFKENEVYMPSINHFLSISAVGYQFAIAYGCLKDCYALSGKPQDFILRCVSGGRCMTANNQKIIAEGKIQDFDAVSLYPSAMYVMNGIPKGIPKIIQEEDKLNILNFDGTKGSPGLWPDAFFIEINIKSLKCKCSKEYEFGLVWKINAKGSKIYCNDPVNNYYVDKRGLLDLLEYYDIEYEIIRGYYFNEGMNTKINEFIKKLFDLRLKYKKEGNALQNTIKLLLNSIYGKSILKSIPTDTKIVSVEDLNKYIVQHYNYINEIEEKNKKAFIRTIKTIDSHFNVPHFGATVLSWSKHLMNRVICLAEQIGIKIYYTDTDSIHIDEEKIEPLADAFKDKYDKELIGSNLTQFHTDFAPFRCAQGPDGSFPNSKGNIYSTMLIALGKKSYVDLLEDEEGNTGYHIRMKGIPEQVLMNYCKNNNLLIDELYLKLYDDEMITFDLTDGCNCFRKTRTFDQVTLNNFKRRVKFN
jgi:DNA polymerase elongation subunit (family B)